MLWTRWKTDRGKSGERSSVLITLVGKVPPFMINTCLRTQRAFMLHPSWGDSGKCCLKSGSTVSLPFLPMLHTFTRDAQGNQTGEPPRGSYYKHFSSLNPLFLAIPSKVTPAFSAESRVLAAYLSATVHVALIIYDSVSSHSGMCLGVTTLNR